MQCSYQKQFPTFQRYNQHRRVCAVYHADLFREAAQITVNLTGQVGLISRTEWETHRPAGYPTASTVSEWWGGSRSNFLRAYAAAVGLDRVVPAKWGRRAAPPPALETELPAGQFVSRDVPISNVLLLINAAYGTEFARQLYRGLQAYGIPSRAATRRYGVAA